MSFVHGTDKRERFDIRRFGARGLGGDETAAFERLRDALASEGSGRAYVPHGHYYVDPIAFASSDIEIYGDGPATLIEATGVDQSCFAFGGAAVAVRYENISVHHLRFKQPSPHSNDNWAAVQFGAVTNGRAWRNLFDSCWVALRFGYGGSGLADRRSIDCQAGYNRMVDTGYVGLEWFHSLRPMSMGNHIVAETAGRGSSHAIRDCQTVAAWHVGNSIQGHLNGVSIQGGTFGPTVGTLVERNQIDAPDAYGVEGFNGVEGATIRGNRIRAAGAFGLSFRDGPVGNWSDLVIEANRILADGVSSRGAAIASGTNLSFLANIVEGVGDGEATGSFYDLQLSAVEGAKLIQRNEFRSKADAGATKYGVREFSAPAGSVTRVSRNTFVAYDIAGASLVSETGGSGTFETGEAGGDSNEYIEAP